MKNHYIHYLPRIINDRLSRKRVNDFFTLDQQLDEGFERPRFHITRSRRGPAVKIKVGDIIWLISTIKSPWGKTTPSLDAKIIVENIQITKEGHLKYIASKNSKWYPICDISKCLFQLETIDSKKRSKKLIGNTESDIGIYLQSIRQLRNFDKMEKWSKHVIGSDFHFISYRIKDGTKAAFQKTQELLENGFIVFWDRYCLPRRLSERREFVCDQKLDNYIKNKLKGSIRVWGIESKLYAQEGSYSYNEYEWAMFQKKYYPVVVPAANNG